MLVHLAVVLIIDVVQYGAILDVDVPRLHVYRLETYDHTSLGLVFTADATRVPPTYVFCVRLEVDISRAGYRGSL